MVVQPDIESARPLRHRMRQGDQIFFLHIPKTAGTSLVEVLQMQVDPGAFFSFPDGPKTVQPETMAIAQKARIMRGHLTYDFLKYFTRRPYVITMLRNPYARVISNFAHLTRNNPARLLRIVRTHHPERGDDPVTLEEFINVPSTQNRLVQFLTDFNGAIKKSPDEHLALAKVHLEYLAFFGLMERFDDSMRLLAYTFGWSPIKIEAKLNTAPVESKPAITPEAAALLEKTNGLDMAFYQYATALFDDRLKQMERELKELVDEQWPQTPAAARHAEQR
jgi:hypothetical protein